MGRSKTVSDADALAAVRNLFVTEGYSVSTRRLATAAGLSQATLVQRFGSKERLFAAAMLPEPLDVDAIVRAFDDGGFVAFVSAIVDAVAARLPVMLQIASSPIVDAAVVQAAHDRVGLQEASRRLVVEVEAMKKRGVLSETMDASSVVEAILVAAHGFALMALSSTDGALPSDAVGRFAALFENPEKGA